MTVIEALYLPRILDLSRPEDLELLRQAAATLVPLAELVETELNDYLALFPEQHWRTIFPGGLMTIKGNGRHTSGLSIDLALGLTRSLKKLRKYRGFEKLIAGFRNPAQLDATWFEVLIAEWCMERAITVSLEFSPEVLVKGRSKYPEFLWDTILGKLYVECKRGELFDNDFDRKMTRLHQCIEKEYKSYDSWGNSVRLDVIVRGVVRNGVEKRLQKVIQRAAHRVQTGVPGETFEEGEVRATLRHRSEQPLLEKGDARSCSIMVGTTPTKIDVENAQWTLTMSQTAHRVRGAGMLLREARTQLPADARGAVFIQMGSAEMCQEKIANLLRQEAYVNTPWAAICGAGELRAVWRMNQPFDDRLLVPRIS